MIAPAFIISPTMVLYKYTFLKASIYKKPFFYIYPSALVLNGRIAPNASRAAFSTLKKSTSRA